MPKEAIGRIPEDKIEDIDKWWGSLSVKERVYLKDSWEFDYKTDDVSKLVHNILTTYCKRPSDIQIDYNDKKDYYEYQVAHEMWEPNIVWFISSAGSWCELYEHGMYHRIYLTKKNEITIDKASSK